MKINTLVLNTGNNSISVYDSFPFNSICVDSNNKYYGSNQNGIFIFEGNTDNGEDCVCKIKTQFIDFGTPLLKSIHSVYFDIKADGNYIVGAISTENIKYEYEIADGMFVQHIKRVQIGRGIKGNRIAFTFENINSADFELISLIVHYVSNQRSVIPKK